MSRNQTEHLRSGTIEQWRENRSSSGVILRRSGLSVSCKILKILDEGVEDIASELFVRVVFLRQLVQRLSQRFAKIAGDTLILFVALGDVALLFV